MYSLPNNLNTVVNVTKTTRFYLGHQNGNTVAGYLTLLGQAQARSRPKRAVQVRPTLGRGGYANTIEPRRPQR